MLLTQSILWASVSLKVFITQELTDGPVAQSGAGSGIFAGGSMEFKDWLKEAEIEIFTVAELMNIPLSDDANILEQQIREVECHNYRLASLACQAEYYLTIARAKNLPTGDNTVQERDIILDNATKDEQLIYAKLKYLVGDRNRQGVIATRISVGQSFLKGHMARMSSLNE